MGGVPVKNGFDPLKKCEPLNGVMFEQPTWTFKNNALESVLNSANLSLVMHSIVLLRSSSDLESAVLLIIVLAHATSECFRNQVFTLFSLPSLFMFTKGI